MSVSAFPLQWPAWRPRTPATKRRNPAFSKKIDKDGYKKTVDLTVADALGRLQAEIDRNGD